MQLIVEYLPQFEGGHPSLALTQVVLERTDEIAEQAQA